MSGLDVYPTYKALLLLPRLLLVITFFFANNLRAEDVLLTVNVKKPVALTSDKFLSYTLDPEAVLVGNALSENPERSVNMARALAPAYVRIGGPRTNSMTFQRSNRQQYEPNANFTFTDGDWAIVNQWAKNAGLDVLACIAPQHSDNDGGDSRNALDLISFSDHMGFNTSWQLGYECQKRCGLSGSDMGRNVIRLRSMLDAFPRYSKSVVTGPDVVTYRSKEQQQYLQDYLSVAGTAISAITWHPKFSSITLEPEGVSLHHDKLATDRDVLYRLGGRLMSKKPLWIAESRPEECKDEFLGALVWTRRLGNAAKLGIQVIMRKPIGTNFIQPTPDYWVSVIHKKLVGPEVIDTKISNGNRTHLHFFCQCTKPSSKYEKGSLTIFGINLTPLEIVANIKGIKIKTVHKYILLPGFDDKNRMFSKTVLLNNKPLNLVGDQELPDIEPIISNNPKGLPLKLPSGAIGFWVLPGLKIRSCGGLDEDNIDKTLLKRLTKLLDEIESSEDVDYYETLNDDVNIDEDTSTEDHRFWSKSNVNQKRKTSRFSEEDDALKMDLHRLENLLRKRDNHDDKKLSNRHAAYYEFDNDSKINAQRKSKTDEIIAKLRWYKNRLKELENKNNVDEKSKDSVLKTNKNDTIDSEKVVEAMMLISKMENVMKNSKKLYNGDSIDTWKSIDPRDAKTKKSEDRFLEELLKSKKIQRTSVPAKIEDRLRAIYEMLAEEKARRNKDRETSTRLKENVEVNVTHREMDGPSGRPRRETDTMIGNDNPASRKDPSLRKRLKNDRERRMEKRRKYNNNDNKENMFHGFEKREPLKNFPTGDVFSTTGTSSEKKANDYDYVIDDDEKISDGLVKNYEISKNQPESDDTAWIEDGDSMFNHMPKQLFEDTKFIGSHDRRDYGKFDDLLQLESLGNSWNFPERSHAENVERKIDEIIQESRANSMEERRIKEATIQRLTDYYKAPRFYDDDDGFDYMDPETFDEFGSNVRYRPRHSITSRTMSNRDPIEIPIASTNEKRVRDSRSNGFRSLENSGSTESSKVASSSSVPIVEDIQEDIGFSTMNPVSKVKRSVDDAERMMNEEMLSESTGNSKHCSRRVPRNNEIVGKSENFRKRRFSKKRGYPMEKSDDRCDDNDDTFAERSRRQAVEKIEDTIIDQRVKVVKTIENAETLDKTNLNKENKNLESPQSIVNLQDASSESEQSAVEQRSIDERTKIEVSSVASTNVDKVVDEKKLTTRKKPAKGRTVERVKDKPEDSQKLKNKIKDKSRANVKNSSELRVRNDITDHTRGNKKMSSSTKDIVKAAAKSTTENTKIPKRTLQKTKQQPMKNVEDPKRSVVTKKSAKSYEDSSKLLSNESTRTKKNRAEKLERLREKLRDKRAKITREYRDELIDELDKAAKPEEKNPKRRDIIDMQKSRRRRQSENELIGYDESSASNEIPWGIIGTLNKEKNSENMILQNFRTTDMAMDSIGTKNYQHPVDDDDTDNSIFDKSTIVEVKKFKPTTKQNEKFINDHDVSAIFEIAIPTLETNSIGGQDETRPISQSFKIFMDEFDDTLDRKRIKYDKENPTSTKITKLQNESSMIGGIFDAAVTNVKTFFNFILNFFRTIRFN